MKDYYVAHEVFLVKEFDNIAYAHDLIGCRLKHGYYISKKVVLLGRWKDGDYYYDGTNILAATNVKVDPNDFVASNSVLSCNDCDLSKLMINGNCENTALTQRSLIGVVNIMPLTAFTNVADIELSLMLVKEYNDSILDNEFVLVNDKSYNKTIRKINDDFAKTRRK